MTNMEAISLLSDIRAEYSCFTDREKYHALSMGIDALRERKRGKWIMKEVITGEFGRLIVCQCSKCKKNQTFQTMYCSNCGAEMEFDKGWYGKCMTN